MSIGLKELAIHFQFDSQLNFLRIIGNLPI